MKYFRGYIKKYDRMWYSIYIATQDKLKEIEQNYQNISNDERLRNKKAGPPEPGWEWNSKNDNRGPLENLHQPPKPYRLRGQKNEVGNLIESNQESLVEGWFPPAKIKVPDHPWPWGFNGDGQMSAQDILPAEYLLLALFHDYMLFSKRPLIITERFVKECKMIGLFYSNINNHNPLDDSLIRSCEEHLPAVMKDVQHNLLWLHNAMELESTKDSAEKIASIKATSLNDDRLDDLEVPKPPKEPSKEALQAYKLYFTMGHTQDKVAEIMQKNLKRPVKQGQVSRWLKEIRDWRNSQNLPIEEKASPPKTVDPNKLGMGVRTDGRKTGDVRHKHD